MEGIDNSKKMGYPLAAPNTNYPLQATDKDTNYFESQLNKYHNYLLTNIATNKMVCKVLDIPIENGTRYKRTLEKRKILWFVEKGICQSSRRPANYISCNPKYKPANVQLKLL